MVDTFPFSPNWKDSVELTLSFKTDSFTSRSGLEQRRALRSTPRRTLSYKTMIVGKDYQAFQRTLATKQALDFYLPDWSHPVIRTLGIATGETLLTTREPVPEWCTAGAKVFITEGDVVVAINVAAASGNTVLFSSPVAVTFSPVAVIRRGGIGLLGSISTTASTSTVGSAAIKFDYAPATYGTAGTPFFAYQTGGKEVFAFPWNWSEDVSSQFDWPVEQVDFGRGVVSNYRIQDFGRVTQKVSVLRVGPEIDGMMGFLHRQKGQRGEFWMPTGTADLTLQTTAAAEQSLMTLAGSDAATMFGETYCGVAIYLRDGRKVYRRMGAAATSGGNSLVTVSEPFTFAIDPINVLKISWMRVSRLVSDDATIEYVTDLVTRWQPQTVSLTYRADTQDYAPLDGAARYTMDNWGDDTTAVFDPLQFLVNVRMPGVMG